MKPISWDLRGNEELTRKLRALGPLAVKACAGGLFRSAETIMTTSKNVFVPVDTGNLRASGHVRLPEVNGGLITIDFGFGGPAGIGNMPGENSNSTDVGYAEAVHENPRAGKTGGFSPSGKKYKRYSQVGQWKYLETPVKAATQDIVNELAASINDEFKTLA